VHPAAPRRAAPRSAEGHRPGRQKLDAHDFLGQLETTMGEIVGSRGSCLTRPLVGTHGADGPRPRPSAGRGWTHARARALRARVLSVGGGAGKKYGTIKILAEELTSGANDKIVFRITGSNMPTRDWMGAGDKFIVLNRRRADGQSEPIHKTEVIKNNKNPTFAPFELPINKVNAGKMGTPLTFAVMDWNANSAADFIGEVTFSMQDILSVDKGGSMQLPLTKPNKKDGKDRGQLLIQASVTHYPSFLEYMAGDCNMSMFVAIDFTASNGAPLDPKSLHHKNPNGWNQYQQAIIAVGEILDKYSSDRTFDCYGYGAKIPPSGKVSHCFALNGNAGNPKVPSDRPRARRRLPRLRARRGTQARRGGAADALRRGEGAAGPRGAGHPRGLTPPPSY